MTKYYRDCDDRTWRRYIRNGDGKYYTWVIKDDKVYYHTKYNKELKPAFFYALKDIMAKGPKLKEVTPEELFLIYI